jgi:hypothetical protein
MGRSLANFGQSPQTATNRPTKNVTPSASFWLPATAQEFMAVGYFAEIKGLVRYQYRFEAVCKVR